LPTLTARQTASKEADETVLRTLLASPSALTQYQLECGHHRLLKLLAAKLVKRSGAVKNLPTGRKAIAYELTATGRKRAEKL
jgi:hypothetical protein